jgi:GntR family transcriptional regulator
VVTTDELPPNTRLPGELDLADEYKVSLGTIRRATVELRERGLVVTVPAKGTFVVAKK